MVSRIVPVKKRTKRKIWVWLTLQQIEAVLQVAQVIDAKPESLEAVLPGLGERAAFRGAVTALQNVRSALNEASQ